MAATVVVAAMTGCAQPEDQAACHTPPPEVMAEILGHLIDGGHTRFAVTLAAEDPARVFVSFENRSDRQAERDSSGHILTLTAPDLASRDFKSVDQWADQETDYPTSDVDLRAPGAVASRGCVAARRSSG